MQTNNTHVPSTKVDCIKSSIQYRQARYGHRGAKQMKRAVGFAQHPASESETYHITILLEFFSLPITKQTENQTS